MGSTGVLIGGKPAARMGDPTAHGGVIVAGCPTVLIGEIASAPVAPGVVAPVVAKATSGGTVSAATKAAQEAVAKGTGQGVSVDYSDAIGVGSETPCSILAELPMDPQTDAEKIDQVQKREALQQAILNNSSGDTPGQLDDKLTAYQDLSNGLKANDKAKIAQAAYGGEDPPGFQSVGPDDPFWEDNNIDPSIFNSDSGFKSKLYRSTSGEPPPYTLGIAGTEDATDWKTNLMQGVGFESTQHKEAMLVGKYLKGALGSDGFDVAGHSLGGGLSSTVAMKTGAKATTFNAAGVHRNTARKAVPKKKMVQRAQNVTAYNASRDPLTIIQDNRSWVFRGIGFVLDRVGVPMGTLLGEAARLSGALPEAFGKRIELKTASDSLNPIKQHSMEVMIDTIGKNNEALKEELQNELGC